MGGRVCRRYIEEVSSVNRCHPGRGGMFVAPGKNRRLQPGVTRQERGSVPPEIYDKAKFVLARSTVNFVQSTI
jgi:hypothetical protein